MDWRLQLISLYLLICKNYQLHFSKNMVRISNYSNLTFSDEEVMTIYLFGIIQRRFELKEIYGYADDHLRDWFPKLPSYVAFVQRINKISHLFIALSALLYEQLPHDRVINNALLMDSMPIILAHRGRRFKAKVAQEIATSKRYCATKKLYYYGVKLHMIGRHQKGNLPVPYHMDLSPAGTADIKIYEQISHLLPEASNLFADKAYQKNEQSIAQNGHITLYTPVKKSKGQKALDATDSLISSVISSVRQPIESLFNWLEEKTKIQIASKIRSYEGLMVHIYGKISAALLLLQYKFCS